MANGLHTFTGNEVIATELPELLNQNFNYIQDNSLATVNGIAKDENNNVDVTFLTSQVIPTNSDLNNFRESGEYTRELDTIVVANSPTEKPFFLTVLASENLVKQVVTEIDRKDPMTFTRTLSGANWSPWVEGGVDIGIWKSEETVKVGDVRFLKGRENAGYVLECVKAGVTGESQPEIEIINSNKVANYSDVGRVGQVRVIFNLAEKDVDEVMAMGITYSRLTYPELWEWAGKRAGLIISEEEWQAKFVETNGKFVPYYSSGDGSSTFRTPLFGAYLKGAETSSEVGKYVDAGLPNIYGYMDYYRFNVWSDLACHGAFKINEISSMQAKYALADGTVNDNAYQAEFSASYNNSIYGNSDTVTPETMTGIWVIKAVGVVVDSGETNISEFLNVAENIQREVSTYKDLKADKSALSMPSNSFIDIALPATTTSFYTAPADGFLSMRYLGTDMTDVGYFYALPTEQTTSGMLSYTVPVSPDVPNFSIWLPVSKGQNIQIGINVSKVVTLLWLRFIYAQSEV